MKKLLMALAFAATLGSTAVAAKEVRLASDFTYPPFNYKNAEYDKLFEEMRFMRNTPQRMEIINKLNTIIHAEAPMFTLYSIRRVGMFHKWVRNVKRNVLVHPPLKFMDIDLKKKAEGF